jgi:alanyl aminopeptidase
MSPIPSLHHFSSGARSLALCVAVASIAACGGSDAKHVVVPAPEVLAPAPHGLRLDAAVVVPQRYKATLTLDPSKPTFAGEALIAMDVGELSQSFYLNGHGLEVASATLEAGGESYPLDVQVEDEDWLLFQAKRPFPAGAASLHVLYKGKIDGQSSFGIFRQEAAGDWYLFTQFEARGARRAFPSYDQPDLKVPWALSLKVPKGLVALTNTPEVARKSIDDAWDQVSFAESKPLPSYLVAFAVGPFDVVEIGKTRTDVPVRVATPRGRGQETGWVVESTLQLVEILEDYLGIPYPYAKLDLISIPATGSFGAMENPGLITYSESLLLSKDNSLSFKKAYASVGAHELAHQWFGNLVTNAWWDDLWLNESFATWASAKVLSKFNPAWRSDLSWISRRGRAMNADRLASARVIRQPIVSEGDIGAAFDGITYAKGASVLTMFEGWLGEERFQKGIQHYLGNNQWKSVKAQDFLGAMNEGTGEAVAAPFASFLNNPGTPLVSFELVCDSGQAPVLKLQQERYKPLGSESDASQLYRFPVCVRYPGKGKHARQCTVLGAASAEMELTEGRGCPSWIIPNASATGYYRSQLSAKLMKALWKKAPLTAQEQLVFANDVKALVHAGRYPIETMLALVPKMARSKDDGIVAAAADLASLGRLVADEDRARYAKWIGKNFGKRAKKLSWKAKANELPVRKTLRESLLSLMIFEGQDVKLREQGQALAQEWIADPAAVDPDLAGLALTVGARWGTAEQFDAYLAAIKGSDDRSRRRLLFSALGALVEPAEVTRALAILLDTSIDVRESSRTLSSLAGHRETGPLAFAFLQENFDTLAERYGEEMQTRLGRIVSAQCNAEQKPAVEALLKDKISRMKGGDNVAKKSLESFQLCVAARTQLKLPARL